MLNFTCSSCGKSVQCDESFAGKHVLCPVCSAGMTAPPPRDRSPAAAIATPEHAPQVKLKTPGAAPDGSFQEGPPPLPEPPPLSIGKEGSRILPVLLYCLIGTAVVATLIAMLVPATERVRQASVRTQSTNNLKQITLAFNNFHDSNKRLPFNGSDKAVDNVNYSAVAVANTVTSGTWAFQILPYIDSQPVFATARRDWDFQFYLDPARGRPRLETSNGGGAWTDYFINNYLNDPLQAATPDNADKKRTMLSITDGVSLTIFVGQGNIRTSQYSSNSNVTLSTNIFLGGTTGTMRSGDNGEKDPTRATLQPDTDAAPNIGSWGGPFPQGGFMGLGDGTVRVFPYTMTGFSAWLTPAGDDIAQMPES